MPEDFIIALEQKLSAKEYFEKLSFTSKKEYVTWITEAKKAETRKHELRRP